MAMFVNMLFNEKDKILIKNLFLLKGYAARKLQKDFPSKSWNEQNRLRHQFSWQAVREWQAMNIGEY